MLSKIIIFLFITFLPLCHPLIAYSDFSDEESSALNTLDYIFNKDNNSLNRYIFPFQTDGTIEIMKIRARWNSLSADFRESARKYFVDKHIPDHLSRAHPRSPLMTSKTVRNGHILPNWIETANFSIEWGNNIRSTDGGTDSDEIISCSWSTSSCTGVPDIVDKWAEYFEEVWSKEVVELGFINPTGTENYLYEIYIANTGDNIEGNNDDTTPSLGFGFLGITTTYCDLNGLVTLCAEKISDAYSYIVVNGYIHDENTMKITAAHEFFHAIQFGYLSVDSWFNTENTWWIEATATWMEEVVYDDINNYYQKVRSWLKKPWLSLKYSDNQYEDHEYGDVLFIIFLTELYLKDSYLLRSQDFVRHAWEEELAGLDAIDKVLREIYGKPGFDEAFKEFVALNGVADIGYELGGYEEGAQYGRAQLTDYHDTYPVTTTEIAGETAPQELGSNYIQFLPPDNNNHTLVTYFDGLDDINWATILVKVRSDGSGFEKEEMYLISRDNNGCHSISGFGVTYNEVLLIPLVLTNSDSAFTGSASYRYSAVLDESCEESASAYMIENDSGNTVGTGNDNRVEGLEDTRCFIATAAFGSTDSLYVKVLRRFRDKYLKPYRIGRSVIDMYYSISPPMASFIKARPVLRLITRIILIPAVSIAFLYIHTSMFEKVLLVCIILLYLIITNDKIKIGRVKIRSKLD